MASNLACMDATQAIEQVRQGRVAPVYVVTGAERFLAEAFLRELKTAIFAGVPDELVTLNIKKFDDDSLQLQEVLAAANQYPMFVPRRLVMVAGDPWLAPGGRSISQADLQNLEAYLANPVSTTVLVFHCRQIDRRLRVVAMLEPVAVFVECNPLSPQAATTWLIQTAEATGVRVLPAAAQLLVSLAGTDLHALNTELDKLIAYAGNDSIITTKHVEDVVADAGPLRVFDLLDYVAQRKADRALSELARLLDRGEAPLMLLAMITRQTRSLLQIQLLSAQGYSRAEIQKQLKLHSFVLRKLYSQLRFWSQDDATTALIHCVDTETAIKTGRLVPETGLELLVTRLAGRLTAQPR